MRNNYIFRFGLFKSKPKGRIEDHFSTKTRLLLTLLILITGMISVNGQTLLVDPTGVGGFENTTGTIYSPGAWNFVNSSINKWFIGANSTPNTGAKAAYISNDNGVSNVYTTNNANYVYSWMYRDITVPAGQTKITLSYYYKSTNAGYDPNDKMLVYVAPTSTVPAADDQPLFGTYINSGVTAFGQPSYTQVTYVVPGSLIPSNGGTFRLIIGWTNDKVAGVQAPASIDDISVVSDIPDSFTSVGGGSDVTPLLWNAAATWTAVPRAGIITTDATSNILTGIGTTFLSQLAVGSIVKNATGDTIGTIAAITSDTAATFTSNATQTTTGISYTAQVVPPAGSSIIINTGSVVNITTSAVTMAKVTVKGSLFQSAVLNITDDLIVDSGALFVLGYSTGNTCNVAGNIKNDGTINASLTNATLVLNGFKKQTIDGSGNFHNASTAVASSNFPYIYKLTFSNTLITTTAVTAANIEWKFNNTIITNTLTFTSSTTNIVDLGGNKMTLGQGSSIGTLSGAAVNFGLSSGFLTGGKFSRNYLAATVGGSLTAGADPNALAGRYPFVTANGYDRSYYIVRTLPTAAGEIAVTYTNASTISTVSLAESVNRQLDAKWAISTEGTTPSSTSISVGIAAQYGIYITNGNARVLHNDGITSTLLGTHQNGTSTPAAQRITIPYVTMTGDYYMGYNVTDSAVYSIANGNWNTPGTWSSGSVPTSSNSVVIAAGTNVTVDSGTGNAAKSLIIAGDASLTMSASGTVLTVASGTFFNSSLINNGTLTINNGTLNVNGNLLSNGISTFSQFGGAININGSDGTTGNSVLTGTSICNLQNNVGSNLNLTGGTLTIVNPHIGAAATDYSLLINAAQWTGVPAGSSTSHTLKFGDGISTVAGGSTKGFLFFTTNYVLGSVEVSSKAGGTNRVVNPNQGKAFSVRNLTIKSGGEFNSTIEFYICGDFKNDGIATFQSTLGLAYAYIGMSGSVQVSAAINAQTISGSGSFRTLYGTPAVSIDSLNSLLINNVNPSGVTLNTPLSYTGSITFNGGNFNTDDTNFITAGNLTNGIINIDDSSGAKTTSYVNGTFGRVVPSGCNASALFAKTYAFPVGKAGSANPLAPIVITPTTTALTVLKVKFDNTTTGGTASPSITNLAGLAKWNIVPATAGAITNMSVKLGYSTLTDDVKIPVSSATATGQYTSSFGSSSVWTAATTNSVPFIKAAGVAIYAPYVSFADARQCSSLGTITTNASAATFCLGEKINFSLTSAAAGYGLSYQWQSSTNDIAYTDIVGATATTYSAFPAAATYYRCKVTCSAGSNTVSIGVLVTPTNNSTPTTTAVSRCGSGTVNLAASAGGAAVKWYTSASPVPNDTDYVGTGNPLTVSVPIGTSTYYASSQNDNGTGAFTMTNVSPIVTGSGFGTNGQIFSSADGAVINSIDYFPSTAGDNVFTLYATTTGKVLGAPVPGASYTINISLAQKTAGLPVTVPVNFTIPAGATNYCIASDKTSLRFVSPAGTNSYPYITNGFAITGHIADGTTVPNSNNMSFFNWNITSKKYCATPRVPLVATAGTTQSSVTPLTAPVICGIAGASTTIAVTTDATPAATYAWESQVGAGAWLPITANANYTIAANGSLVITKTTATVPAAGTNYRLTVTGCGTPVTSNVVALQDSPVSVVKALTVVGGKTTICSGAPVELSLAAGNVGTVQFWTNTNNAGWVAYGDPIDSSGVIPFSLDNMYDDTQFKAVVTSGVCSSVTSNIVSIIVSNIPHAGTLTPAATSVCSGTNSTNLSLATTSGTLKWYSSTTDPDVTGTDTVWTLIPGATSGAYTASNLTASTWYKAIATTGCGPDDSTIAAITVDPVSVVTPLTVFGSTAVCPLDTVSLSLAAGNVGSVQWMKNTNNSGWVNVGSPVVSTGVISLTSGALTAATAFRAVVTSGTCSSVTSNVINITINSVYSFYQDSDHDGYGAGSLVPSICAVNATTPPFGYSTSNRDCNDDDSLVTTATLPVTLPATSLCTLIGGTTTIAPTVHTASGAGYVWQYQSVTATTEASWVTIVPNGNYTGQGTNKLTITRTTTSLPTIGTKYRLKVTGCSNTVTSTVVSLTGSAAAKVTTLKTTAATTPVNTICSGTSVSLTLAAGNVGDVAIQSSLNGTDWSTFKTFTAAQSVSAQNFDSGNLTQSAYFRAEASNGGGCKVHSSRLFISVSPVAVTANPTATSSTKICAATVSTTNPGGTTNSAGMTVGNNTVGALKWYSTTTNPADTTVPAVWTAIAGATAKDYTASNLTKTTWFKVRATTSACHFIDSAAPLRIDVTPIPKAGIVAVKVIGTPITICQGQTIDLAVTGCFGTVKWEKSVNYDPITKLGTWIAAGGDDTVIGTVVESATLNYTTIASLSPGDTYFRVSVTNGVCSSAVTSSPFKVKVSATAVAGTISAPTTICKGAGTTVSLTDSFVQTGGTYSWFKSTNGGSTWVAATAVIPTLTTLPELVVPILNKTTMYKATAISGKCTAGSGTTTITVTPAAVAGTIDIAPKSACYLGSASFHSTPYTGDGIQWQYSQVSATTTVDADWHNFGTANETSATLTLTPEFTAGSSFFVRAKYSSQGTTGCTTVAYSPVKTLIVNPTSSVGTASAVVTAGVSSINGAYVVCTADTGTVTVAEAVGKIQWKYSLTAANDASYLNVPAVGVTGAPFTAVVTTTADGTGKTATYAFKGLTGSVYLKAFVTSGLCSAATSNAVHYTTSSLVSAVAGTLTADLTTLCPSLGTTLRLSGNVGATVKWQKKLATETVWTTFTVTGNSYNTEMLAATTNYQVISKVGSCSSATASVTVNVKNAVAKAIIPADAMTGTSTNKFCVNNHTKVLNVNVGSLGDTYVWETKTSLTALSVEDLAKTNNVGWTTVGNTNSLTITSPVAGINYFRVRISYAGCGIEAVSAAFAVYYKTCTSAPVGKMDVVEEATVTPFAVVGYPNPYTENFNLKVSTASVEKIGVVVYDIAGRLLDQREVTPNQVSELQFGDRYPTGVYNIIVTQGTEVKTLRVIKQ